MPITFQQKIVMFMTNKFVVYISQMYIFPAFARRAVQDRPYIFIAVYIVFFYSWLVILGLWFTSRKCIFYLHLQDERYKIAPTFIEQ